MTVSLKHSFTNPKADGPDATIVRPSDWNAEHAYTMATGKLLGRSTASTGAVEELTVGTGLSLSGGTLTASASPGGSTAQAQYNNAGAFGGASGLLIDAAGNPVIAQITTPSTPSAGATLFARRRAGRHMAAQIGPIGRWYEFQPSLGATKIGFAQAAGAGTGITIIGITAATASGTATTRTIANTSLLASTRRIGYVITAAAADSPTGWSLAGAQALWWRGNAAGVGGFCFVARFGFNSFTGGAGGNRAFIGLTAIPWTTADPSNLLNMVGIGLDSGDANFFVMTNDGSGSPTKTDTAIAVVADKLYEVRVFCSANDTKIAVSLERLDDGVLYEQTVTTDLPVNTTFLGAAVRANSGSSATTGAAIDILQAYIETDF
jgi:hypothetical protein